MTKYYKFDIGDGIMRRNGVHVDHLDSRGEWIEDRELIRKFIGGDTDFEKITEKEVLELINKRKKNQVIARKVRKLDDAFLQQELR